MTFVLHQLVAEPPWTSLHGSWIYNYTCAISAYHY